MVHVTCLAHAMHRIAEDICVKFPGVVKLISRVKRVFLKAPSRTVLFRTEAPDISLPPETILTHCGTWICAINISKKYTVYCYNSIRVLQFILKWPNFFL